MPHAGVSLQAAMVQGHNAARRLAGQRPLAWNNDLAASAANCAAKLAQSDSFEHCAGSSRDSGHGENLWSGTRSAYSYAEMVGSWVDERKFDDKIHPPGSPGKQFSEETGHYDQIVWPDTRSFGCSIATSRTMDYLVCEYDPPGNVYSE